MHYFYLQEHQEGGLRELQASQHQLDPWEGDGRANPQKHFHEGEENKQEKSALIHQGEIMPDHPGKPL